MDSTACRRNKIVFSCISGVTAVNFREITELAKRIIKKFYKTASQPLTSQ